jgi:hypothetical protein
VGDRREIRMVSNHRPAGCGIETPGGREVFQARPRVPCQTEPALKEIDAAQIGHLREKARISSLTWAFASLELFVVLGRFPVFRGTAAGHMRDGRGFSGGVPGARGGPQIGWEPD